LIQRQAVHSLQEAQPLVARQVAAIHDQRHTWTERFLQQLALQGVVVGRVWIAGLVHGAAHQLCQQLSQT
jgi:hypothetical protein